MSGMPLDLAELRRVEAAYPGQSPTWCTTCGHPGGVLRRDERGLLVAHPGRTFPCRIPRRES